MQKKIKLFANCIPVKGASRSLICDLQRFKVQLIPNDLYDLLEKYESKTIEEILSHYEGFEDIVTEYVDFLLNNEFAFLTDNSDLFPKLNLSWYEPFQINNAIVDIDKNSFSDYRKIARELDSLNCKYVEVRCFDCDVLKAIDLLDELTNISSMVMSVDIYVNSDFVNHSSIDVMSKSTRLSKIILYNSKETTNMNYPNIVYVKENINSDLCCGIVKIENFSSNIKLFTESQHHNTCLNRKISIDKDGNIKNCPSMAQSFGNIKDTTLEEALNHPDFKKYWNVTKDQIEVCKDCEFRHICTDCRAYTERTHFEEDIDLSKPLKCGYNPYTNEWAEWSTNPLKQKAIEYYGMQELVKNA